MTTDNIIPEKEEAATVEEIQAPPFHEIEAFGLKVKSDDSMSAVFWIVLLVALGYIFKVAVDSVFVYVVDWYKHKKLK